MRVTKSIRGLSRRDFIRIAGLGVIAGSAVPVSQPLAALGFASGALTTGALKLAFSFLHPGFTRCSARISLQA